MMFGVPFLLIMTVVFSAIQISVWSMFPKKIRDILLSNPALAFIVNIGGSNLILAFTGVASMVGASNLCASVVFGVYAVWYKKSKNIKGLRVHWNKLLRVFPIIPSLEVKYGRGSNLK